MNAYFGSTLTDAQNAISRQAQMEAAQRMAAEQGLRDMLMQAGRLGSAERISTGDREQRREAAGLLDALERFRIGQTTGIDRERLGLEDKRVGLEGERVAMAKEAQDRADQFRAEAELARQAEFYERLKQDQKRLEDANAQHDSALRNALEIERIRAQRNDPRLTQVREELNYDRQARAQEAEAIASQLNRAIALKEDEASKRWRPLRFGSWDDDARKAEVNTFIQEQLAKLGPLAGSVRWNPGGAGLAGGSFSGIIPMARQETGPSVGESRPVDAILDELSRFNQGGVSTNSAPLPQASDRVKAAGDRLRRFLQNQGTGE